MKYHIIVNATVEMCYEVEAESEEEAKDMAKDNFIYDFGDVKIVSVETD